MTVRLKFAAQVMRTNACLHADQASMPIVATVGFDLLDMTVLRLIVALSQHHALVGQEHGRTIPLAVLDHCRSEGLLWVDTLKNSENERRPKHSLPNSARRRWLIL